MNKLKNFLYDTNDILVAIIIICCAALVIVTRVDAIMTYPEKMLSEQQVSQGGYIRPEPSYPTDQYKPGVSVEPSEPTDEEPPEETPSDEPVNYSLYIGFGQSMNVIADNLVELGFFENRQDFFSHVARNNADQKVQAGTFILPSDSTKDRVIEIITGN